MGTKFTGIVLFDTIEGGSDNLFIAPLCFHTKEKDSYEAARRTANELACDRLTDGAKVAQGRGDEGHFDLLINAANEMLRWMKHTYTLPKTVNHPGGTFVVRVIVSEREE